MHGETVKFKKSRVRSSNYGILLVS